MLFRSLVRHGHLPILLLAQLLSSTAVMAQTVPAAAGGGTAAVVDSGEIVVTARKKEETLVSIPLSIQAFTGADLQKKGVESLQDLAKFTPSLFFVNSANGNGRQISEVRFRGLSTSGTSVVNQYGSVFEDGVYVMNGAQAIGFADVERAEVVKGPQSAYFGRATFAGAVNFITRDPADVLKASVATTYSPTFGSYDLAASVEGPLAAGILSARLSGQAKHKGAQYTASDGGDLGEEDTRTLNLSLLFTPSSSTRIKIHATYGETDDSAALSAYYAYNTRGNCRIGTPVTVNTTAGSVSTTLNRNYQCGALPFVSSLIDRNTALITLPANATYNAAALSLYDVFVNNSLNDPLIADAPTLTHMGTVSKFWRATANMDQDITDKLKLTVAGGYAKQDLNSFIDTDGSASPSNYSATPLFFKNWSIEGRLRYDNGSWLSASIGTNYIRAEYRGSQDTGVAIINLNQSGSTVTRVARSAPSNSNENLETLGIFGGVDITPIDWLTLTAEGRYQIDDDTKFAGSNAAGTLVAQTLTSKNFTPRIILTVRPMAETTIYGSYSVGVLPGTANTTFIALSPADQAKVLAVLPEVPAVLDSEKLNNYEIGIKKAFPAARANFSLAAFQMDWSNLKTSTTIVVPSFANPIFGVQLPGTARIKGFEFDGRWGATTNLTLQATAGYLDAKFRQYTNTSYNAFFVGLPTGATFSAEGLRLPRTPDWSGSLSAIWTDALTADWDYSLRADGFYTGSQFVDETNLTELPSYATANASIELTRGTTSVRLYVNNLFNKGAWLTGRRFLDLTSIPWNAAASGQGAFLTPIDRREIGMTLRQSF